MKRRATLVRGLKTIVGPTVVVTAIAGCASASGSSPASPVSAARPPAATTAVVSKPKRRSTPGLHGIVVLSCPSGYGDYRLTAYSPSGSITGGGEFNVPSQTLAEANPVVGECNSQLGSLGPQLARSSFNSDYSRLAVGTGYVARGTSRVTPMTGPAGFSGPPPLETGFYVAPTNTFAAIDTATGTVDSVAPGGKLRTLFTIPTDSSNTFAFGAYGRIVGAPSDVLSPFSNHLVADSVAGPQLYVGPVDGGGSDQGTTYPAACSPQGWVTSTRILCTVGDGTTSFVGIYDITRGGQSFDRLTPDTSRSLDAATLSPDGRSFAFLAGPASDSTAAGDTLYTGSTAGLRNPRLITQLSTVSTLVAWGK